LELAEIPHIKFHLLRHSATTLLKSLGVDTRIIADICGHAEESTTDRIYTHTNQNNKQNIRAKRTAINKLNKIIAKKPKKHQPFSWCFII
jgi:integrase